jgi:hypothetical protein
MHYRSGYENRLSREDRLGLQRQRKRVASAMFLFMLVRFEERSEKEDSSKGLMSLLMLLLSMVYVS